MIIVKLIGGLGNQMFQYATGRRLAHELGVDLKLDISGFNASQSRRYDLSVFNIQEDFISGQELVTLVPAKSGKFRRLMNCFIRDSILVEKGRVEELALCFNPKVLTLSDGSYLDGYWQCEKYFIDIKEILKVEFQMKTAQDGKNKELAEMIASTDSVSIHVRRGDYLSAAHQTHGLCDLNYYKSAVQLLLKTIARPSFFIFSDDIAWCREHLNLQHPTVFVDHNAPDNAFEDLRLMSQCKHNIIANSSFSWWAAWLNQHKDKIVIAPSTWFISKQFDGRDIVPSAWIKIPDPAGKGLV